MTDTHTPTTRPGDAPDGTPAPTVWACLSYADARAAIRFLVDAFGFVEHLVVEPDEDREVPHAELLWPLGGGIMLGSYDRDADSPFAQVRPGTGSTYVVCDDPDSIHDRAVAAGAEIVMPLTDTHYGSRDFSARDPEGSLWSFGTWRGAPRPS